MSDIDLIVERMELRGHRVTESRRRVINAVLAQPSHFTVEDVLRASRRTGRATVFGLLLLIQLRATPLAPPPARRIARAHGFHGDAVPLDLFRAVRLRQGPL